MTLAPLALEALLLSVKRTIENELTDGHNDRHDASDAELPLQEVDGDADLDDVGPDLVHRLPALDNTFNIGTHHCHRCSGIHVLEAEYPRLAIDNRDETSTDHSNSSVGPVLVLARRDLKAFPLSTGLR